MTTAKPEDFSRESFSYDNRARDIFVLGSGPAVVIMPEIPGLTPEVLGFAQRVAASGFTVFAVDLFGEPGKAFSNSYAAQSFVKACVSREFVAFARNKKSPITDWLGALVQHVHQRVGGRVGVVGMCFTGGFALALAVDPAVRVAVMSQPALPLGPMSATKRDVGVTLDQLRIVSERANEDDLCVIGLRLTADPLVPAERFARLRSEIGESFVAVEIDSSKGNPHGFKSQAHSVLTAEYRDEEGFPTKEAHDLVIDHFQRLLAADPEN